jgi:hypothetical protein
VDVEHAATERRVERPGERSALRRRGAEFLLFLLVGTVLHVPALIGRLFSSDEASIASMAMVIDKGGRLYHQTADRKPPVVPYVYAAVFEITHSRDLRPVRAVGIIVLAFTALLLAMEAERRYRNKRRGIACGCLFLIASAAFFPADTQAATFELFMLLPMTAAVIAARERRPIVSGICLALATLCKQTALTTALPITWILLPQGRKAVVRAALSTAAVLVGTAVFFGPSQFFLWTVTGNGGYLKVVGPVLPVLLTGLGMTALFVIANGVVIAFAARSRNVREQLDLWLWVASGIVAVVAGLRFFGHYYLQLLPPLTLLAAGSIPVEIKNRRMLAAAAIVPSAIFVMASYASILSRNTASYPVVAKQIKRLANTPKTTMFVWGQLPELYWASGVEPGTRFIHSGFLTGNSGGRQQGAANASDGLPGAWQMLEQDIAAHPPTLIADTTAAHVRGSQYYPLQQTPIWPTVRREYREVEVVDNIAIYEVRTPPPVSGVAHAAEQPAG